MKAIINMKPDQLKDNDKSKSERYLELVEEFKKYSFKDRSLINPHKIFDEFGFKFDIINPWELWQNNLDAEIMFIGQDFSDTAYLRKNLKDNWQKEKNNKTNEILIDFFTILGPRYSFDGVDYSPKTKKKHPLFFTNAILGIKQSKLNDDGTEKEGLSLPVKDSWYKETQYFLKELIDIIKPKYIIAMGRIAYKAVCNIYDIKPKGRIDAIETPTRLSKDQILFTVQHCSGLGQGTRNLTYQYNDWPIIRSIIDPDS